MGSTADSVSVFVVGIFVAQTVATLFELEGDAIGAVGWRPLSAIKRVIPILVILPLPLETAAGAISPAAPFAIIKAKGLAPAGAILFGRVIC